MGSSGSAVPKVEMKGGNHPGTNSAVLSRHSFPLQHELRIAERKNSLQEWQPHPLSLQVKGHHQLKETFHLSYLVHLLQVLSLRLLQNLPLYQAPKKSPQSV
ncbi:hypothetical protein AMTR_s00043p00224600 [Amborella trichopoda]|uniref:Uncharacterized protein n=1 Tax=Amborella trichopoda TaxID=13333 RepID=W1PX65_AMBTC|nr:hypothetical protein AMTR_s00043p00224600 [Amborella trichopoda]